MIVVESHDSYPVQRISLLLRMVASLQPSYPLHLLTMKYVGDGQIIGWMMMMMI